jgi:hypothetical protein
MAAMLERSAGTAAAASSARGASSATSALPWRVFGYVDMPPDAAPAAAVGRIGVLAVVRSAAALPTGGVVLAAAGGGRFRVVEAWAEAGAAGLICARIRPVIDEDEAGASALAAAAIAHIQAAREQAGAAALLQLARATAGAPSDASTVTGTSYYSYSEGGDDASMTDAASLSTSNTATYNTSSSNSVYPYPAPAFSWSVSRSDSNVTAASASLSLPTHAGPGGSASSSRASSWVWPRDRNDISGGVGDIALTRAERSGSDGLSKAFALPTPLDIVAAGEALRPRMAMAPSSLHAALAPATSNPTSAAVTGDVALLQQHQKQHRFAERQHELALCIWRNYVLLRHVALRLRTSVPPESIAALLSRYGEMPWEAGVSPELGAAGISRLAFWLASVLPLPHQFAEQLLQMTSLVSYLLAVGLTFPRHYNLLQGERCWMLLQLTWPRYGDPPGSRVKSAAPAPAGARSQDTDTEVDIEEAGSYAHCGMFADRVLPLVVAAEAAANPTGRPMSDGRFYVPLPGLLPPPPSPTNAQAHGRATGSASDGQPSATHTHTGEDTEMEMGNTGPDTARSSTSPVNGPGSVVSAARRGWASMISGSPPAPAHASSPLPAQQPQPSSATSGRGFSLRNLMRRNRTSPISPLAGPHASSAASVVPAPTTSVPQYEGTAVSNGAATNSFSGWGGRS